MKKAYPVIMSRDGEWIVVDIPDFEIGTQGKDFADAMEMARDAMGMVGIVLEDEGKQLPEPSALESVNRSAGEIATLVDVDFTEYRRQNDLRTVRRNVSLPSWLDSAAKKANINVSALLANALKQELHLSDA